MSYRGPDQRDFEEMVDGVRYRVTLEFAILERRGGLPPAVEVVRLSPIHGQAIGSPIALDGKRARLVIGMAQSSARRELLL